MGVLRPQSDLVGKTVGSCRETAGINALRIIAILRDGNVVLPEQDTLLQKNDWILMVGSAKARSRMTEHLAPLPVPKKDTTSTKNA